MDTIRTLLQRGGRRFLPRPVRNWLRSPARSWAWLLAECEGICGGIRHRELVSGCRLVVHPVADRFGYAAYDEKGGEPDCIAEMQTFASYCCPRMVLVDVGAHFGVFSLAALRLGGEDARAVAVEPSRGALRLLRAQRRLNRDEERLTIVEAAASDRPGSIPLVSEGVAALNFCTDPRGRVQPEVDMVRAVTVDGLVAEVGICATHLKIDVEGQEEVVLRGAESCLRRDRPVLFLELHNDILRSRGDDPESVIRFLNSKGYRLTERGGDYRDKQVARLVFEPHEGL